MRVQGFGVVKKFSLEIGMDKVLVRLVNLRWYIYRQPDIAVGILKQISDEIQELLHSRTVSNWVAMSKGGIRRSQSLPNFYSALPFP
jgi:hypothetical protein